MTHQAITSMIHEEAYALLQDDANQIYRLIKSQLKYLDISKNSLYEDVLDTHMFGLSQEIDFAVRLNLINKADGKRVLEHLEIKLSDYIGSSSEGDVI